MPPKEKPRKGPTVEDLMALPRRERRKILKRTGVKLPGTTRPLVRQGKDLVPQKDQWALTTFTGHKK